MASMRPVLDCTFRPPRSRIRMTGDFDLSVRDHLADVLTCLRVRGCSIVEVDAQDVTFVDAACIAVLHQEAHRLRDADGILRIVAASATFTKIVEVAGYQHLIFGDASDGARPPVLGADGRAERA